MIYEIGNPCGEPPVVSGVFEQVADRHGAVGETMNKAGFQ